MANLGFTAETLLTGRQRPRMGNDIFGAFGRDFTTRDGQTLMLLAITPRQWSKALEALGIAARGGGAGGRARRLLRHGRGPAVHPSRPALSAVRARPSPQRTAAELAPAFDAGGVTWGAYQPLEAALDDPRLYKDNPVFEDIRHPSGLNYPAPGAMAHDPAGRARRRPARAAAWSAYGRGAGARCWACRGGEIARLHDDGVVASWSGQPGAPS